MNKYIYTTMSLIIVILSVFSWVIMNDRDKWYDGYWEYHEDYSILSEENTYLFHLYCETVNTNNLPDEFDYDSWGWEELHRQKLMRQIKK